MAYINLECQHGRYYVITVDIMLPLYNNGSVSFLHHSITN